MDQALFVQWLREPRAICPLSSDRHRILFLDNCSGHTLTQKVLNALNEIRTTIRYLPPNTTHLCQPLDSFLIQKFKQIWRNKWDAEKLRLCKEQEFSPASGKIRHPTRHCYMRTAVECVQDINNMTDEDGISYTRKCMIRCGLSKNTDGVWTITQLSPELQSIIAKYSAQFNGSPINSNNAHIESESEKNLD